MEETRPRLLVGSRDPPSPPPPGVPPPDSVLPSRPEHPDRPVAALRQQLRRVAHLPGRVPHEHDPGAVLQGPAGPPEALPALWRQRRASGDAAAASTQPVWASSRACVSFPRSSWAEALSCCSSSRTWSPAAPTCSPPTTSSSRSARAWPPPSPWTSCESPGSSFSRALRGRWPRRSRTFCPLGSDANLQHLSVLQLSDAPPLSSHRSGRRRSFGPRLRSRSRSDVCSLRSAEPSDGGGALLPDRSPEGHHPPDLQPPAEPLPPPLEPHDVHRGAPARSAAVSSLA